MIIRDLGEGFFRLPVKHCVGVGSCRGERTPPPPTGDMDAAAATAVHRALRVFFFFQSARAHTKEASRQESAEGGSLPGAFRFVIPTAEAAEKTLYIQVLSDDVFSAGSSQNDAYLPSQVPSTYLPGFLEPCFSAPHENRACVCLTAGPR